MAELHREEYHTLLADALAARENADPETTPGGVGFLLAYHHLRGGRPEQARPFLDRALHHLAASYRNEAALDLARRALGRPGLLEGEQRVHVLLHQIGRLNMLGRRED